MSKITNSGIYRFLMNTTIYKSVAVCAMMLSPVIFFCFADEIISIVLLAWAAFILVNDLFGERRFMKAPYSVLLLAFIVSYTVTILLHLNNQIAVTFNWYFWLAVQFFVLYAFFDKKDIKGLAEEMRKINIPVTVVALLCAAAGIAVYLLRISILFPDSSNVEGAVMFGIIRDRNFGVFNNPIPFSCAMYVGIAASIWNLVCGLKRDAAQKHKKLSHVYYCVVAVICVIAMHTTFTRTYIFAAYFTVAASAVLAFILYSRNNIPFIKRLLKGVVCAAALLGVMAGVYLAEKVAFPAVASLSSAKVYYYDETSHGFNVDMSGNTGVTKDDVTMERTEYGEGFLGPRAKIWRISLDVIPHSPVLGFTTGNRMSSSIEFDKTGYIETKHQEGIRTYDNAYIDIAVSAGLLGLAIIVTFIAINAVRTLKVVFSKKYTFDSLSDAALYSVTALNSCVHALFCCMFLSLLIFAGNSTCIYFWVMLGCLARYNDIILGKNEKFTVSGVFNKILKAGRKANG